MKNKHDGSTRKRITIERTYNASIEDVWALWTTKAGIEAWWGPDGFAVKVQDLDLRPGGELRYAMTAVAPLQVAFMNKMGMPLTTKARLTYTEIVVNRCLAYSQLADFISGIKPYDVTTVMELHPGGRGVCMVLNFDVMHDQQWTQRAKMGRESELGRLAKLLSGRNGKGRVKKSKG
jgi:hypothetical protein